MARFARYTAGARLYDVLSGERWVYAAGRRAGLELLDARPGDVVIDLGCGTGLNLPGLIAAVGPDGLVVGIDRSPEMLAMAARRVAANGWEDRVRLVEADAVTVRPDDIAAVISTARGPERRVANALLTTYALSVIPARAEAWHSARMLLRDGARAVVVDMQPPRGRWRFLSPLARLACAAGGSDITARPWRMLERDATNPPGVRRAERKGGHIVAVGGVLGVPPDRGRNDQARGDQAGNDQGRNDRAHGDQAGIDRGRNDQAPARAASSDG